MASKVYFANTRATGHNSSMIVKLNKLFEKAGFDEFIEEDDMTAIKLHFGEKNNTAFIRPIYIRKLVEAVKEAEGKPFLTDAYHADSLISVAHFKGYQLTGFGGTFKNIGMGLGSRDYELIEI